LIIPRQSVRTFEDADALRRLHAEDRARTSGDLRGDRARTPNKARELMRRHLLNGRDRYRQLLAGKAK